MKITSEQEMLTFGKQFAKELGSNVIELIGDVGAGKTTFVRGLAKGLGVKENVTSPSFTISKSYALPNGQTLIHYDFYRLQKPGIMANDLNEKINSDNIIIIEWGNSIQNLLPKDHTVIHFSKNDDDSREIIIRDNRSNAFSGVFASNEAQVSAGSPVTTSRAKRLPKSIAGLSLYLDTSSPTTFLKLGDKEYAWDSGHNLAEQLLAFIHDKLQENGKDWHDIKEIIFMSGPGSFTGLRIGATIVNTLASELNIPLKNHKGETVKIILPDYGRDANISKPRK